MMHEHRQNMVGRRDQRGGRRGTSVFKRVARPEPECVIRVGERGAVSRGSGDRGVDVVFREQVGGDGGTERGLFRIRREGLQCVGRGFGGVEAGGVGVDVWGRRVGVEWGAGGVDIEVVEAVGAAGVDGGLGLG